MLGSQKPRHTIHDSGDPTQYASRAGFNSEAYCEASFVDDPLEDPPSRNRPSPITSAVVILLTAFGLAVAILATVKLNEPSEPARSDVVWDSVRTALSSSPAPPGTPMTVTVTPTGSPPAPVTVTTREAPPATMTNPVLTTTVTTTEAPPATMTNPVVTTTVTNPVVTTTVTNPEPAPATMTNPLEPPATMTNPLEPPATMSNPVEPPATMSNPVGPTATMSNPVEPPASMTNPVGPNGYETYEAD